MAGEHAESKQLEERPIDPNQQDDDDGMTPEEKQALEAEHPMEEEKQWYLK